MSILKIVKDKEKFEEYQELLSNWKQFSKKVYEMTEDELKECMYVESKSRQRISVMLRIKGRLNIVRNKRETVELMKLSK